MDYKASRRMRLSKVEMLPAMVHTGLKYSLKNCLVLENSLKMIFLYENSLNLKNWCLNFTKNSLGAIETTAK